MDTQVIAGQVVKLIADGGQMISRAVVAVENGVIFVCKKEEFDAAIEEMREPMCIGFRLEYVIEPKLGMIR